MEYHHLEKFKPRLERHYEKHPLTRNELLQILTHFFLEMQKLQFKSPSDAAAKELQRRHKRICSDVSLLLTMVEIPSDQVTETLQEWAINGVLTVERKWTYVEKPLGDLLCAILHTLTMAVLDAVEFAADVDPEGGNFGCSESTQESWPTDAIWHVMMANEILEVVLELRKEMIEKYGREVSAARSSEEESECSEDLQLGGSETASIIKESDEKDVVVEETGDALLVLSIGEGRYHDPRY